MEARCGLVAVLFTVSADCGNVARRVHCVHCTTLWTNCLPTPQLVADLPSQ